VQQIASATNENKKRKEKNPLGANPELEERLPVGCVQRSILLKKQTFQTMFNNPTRRLS
jgi:hypothetical protein